MRTAICLVFGLLAWWCSPLVAERAQATVIDFVHVTPLIDLQQVEEMIRKRGVQLHTSFRAGAGRYSIGFLARDRETGRTTVSRQRVTVE
jgi:hypothetical protein